MGRRKHRKLCTVVEQMTYEVEWYREHGKYPDRIKLDSFGREYVEGDIAWNRQNHYRQETIRKPLADWVAFRVTGIKA